MCPDNRGFPWHPGDNFLKVAAVCSLCSAVTTTALILLPAPAAEGLREQALLHLDPLYLLKGWVFFFHPLLTLVAVIGVCLLRLSKMPGVAVTALIFYLIWAHAEAMQQALVIDALNQYWRPQYLASEDPVTQNALATMMMGFDGLYDSYYFLLLFAFGVASSLLGLLLTGRRPLERFLSACFFFFGVLSILSFFYYYLQAGFLGDFVSFSYTWIYPWLQPLARACLAWLLWQGARCR